MFQSKFKVAIIFASAALAPVVTHAEPCYSAAEIEADSAIRYQAWLRVLALTCNGGALTSEYGNFSNKNQTILAGYEDQLEHYYKAHYKGDPSARLHTRESEASNEESLAATRGGVLATCRAHAGEVQKAAQASPEEIKQQIAAFTIAQPSAKRKCSK